MSHKPMALHGLLQRQLHFYLTCSLIFNYHYFVKFFFNFQSGGGVQTGSTRHVGHLLAYCTYPGWLWGWSIWWNELAGETEVLGENLPRHHFVHHKSHLTRPGLEPGPPAVGSQRLTAWAVARPSLLCYSGILQVPQLCTLSAVIPIAVFSCFLHPFVSTKAHCLFYHFILYLEFTSRMGFTLF
jgi:hypothetical protein